MRWSEVGSFFCLLGDFWFMCELLAGFWSLRCRDGLNHGKDLAIEYVISHFVSNHSRAANWRIEGFVVLFILSSIQAGVLEQKGILFQYMMQGLLRIPGFSGRLCNYWQWSGKSHPTLAGLSGYLMQNALLLQMPLCPFALFRRKWGSRWWFESFLFSSLFGEMIQFD